MHDGISFCHVWLLVRYENVAMPHKSDIAFRTVALCWQGLPLFYPDHRGRHCPDGNSLSLTQSNRKSYRLQDEYGVPVIVPDGSWFQRFLRFRYD